MRFIEQHLDGATIIDIGSGEGKYLRYAKKADHYYAVEREESLRATIDRKCRRDGRENVTILESFDELPVIDGRKTILLTEVIEHNSRKEALALLQRCLMPDSRILVTTPNRDFNVYYFDDETPETSRETLQEQESPEQGTVRTVEFGESEYEDIDMRLRHEDHRFELTDREFREFITTAAAGVRCNVKFFAIGDKVDGISPQSAAVIDMG
jgi:SAM-dependent methyltransferase